MTEFPESATYVVHPGQHARWTALSLQAVERRLQLPLAPLDRLERIVGPTGVLTRVTDVRGELGKFGHHVFPIHPEQLAQAGTVAQASWIGDELGVAVVERAAGRGLLGGRERRGE